MIVEFLNKVSFNRATQIGFILFGNLLAPAMFLFQYYKPVFMTNDFIHLVCICVCIGLPLLIITTGLTILDSIQLQPKEEKNLVDYRFSQMGSCSLLIGFTFYIPCTIKYFRPTTTSEQAIIFLIAIYSGYLILSCISIIRGTTKKLVDELQKR